MEQDIDAKGKPEKIEGLHSYFLKCTKGVAPYVSAFPRNIAAFIIFHS